MRLDGRGWTASFAWAARLVRTPALLRWLGIAACVAPATALAGPADVVAARATCNSSGGYDVSATIQHDDTGWEHYADRWEVLSPEGKVLATRTLRHPHVDEQPVTRELAGVAFPPGLHEARVRAHDSVHGYGGREIAVALPTCPPRSEPTAG
jgi:hypothetical protein